MSFAVLLIPAVGGYWFLTHWNYTRYQTARDAGYHILFRSAFAGVVLYGLARLIILALECRWQGTIQSIDQDFLGPYASDVVLSIILGFLLPRLLNRFYDSDKGAGRAARDNGDQVELLITESIEESKLIEVSLHSRKSYIGYAMESVTGVNDKADLVLFPISSGFRNRDTQDLTITLDYAKTIWDYIETGERPDLRDSDFRIVIPISEIVSARLFIREVYDRFQEPKHTQPD